MAVNSMKATEFKMSSNQFLENRLTLSGITSIQARYAGIKAMTKKEMTDLGGWFIHIDSAFVLHYYDINGQQVDFYRYRLDKPNIEKDSCLYESLVKKHRDFRKYNQVSGTRSHFYFPKVKGVDWMRLAQDATQQLYITEGELKALKATIEGFPTIGLGGVYNFKYRPNGKSKPSVLLPEFDTINWIDRDVTIIFDHDDKLKTRTNVSRARERLSEELERKGAITYKVELI